MAVYASFVIQENSPELNLAFRCPNKEWSLSNDNFLYGCESHKSIKLLYNEVWVYSEREHAQYSTANNHHNIFNNMNLFDLNRVFEISNEAKLFLCRLVIDFSYNSFGWMGK